MSDLQEFLVDEAEVVLHLHIAVLPENRAKFLDFCRKAFPIYESVGGTKMALYEDSANPGRFDEVAYYRSAEDHARSERALDADPVQRRLIQEWRQLLAGPPVVVTYYRSSL